jgi:hypothetical protein
MSFGGGGGKIKKGKNKKRKILKEMEESGKIREN